jgi:hypothetical protein
MTIALYFDEDSMDKTLVQALRARGADVITAFEAGMVARSDEDQLEFAGSENRVLYSFNASDFYHLHSQFLAGGKSHAGIVLSQQQQYSVGTQMRRLLRLIAEVPAPDMRDRIEFLSDWDG